MKRSCAFATAVLAVIQTVIAQQPPQGWQCSTALYQNGQCQCGTCGAFEEECATLKFPNSNCKAGETCDPETNTCVAAPVVAGDPPATWKCSKSAFLDGKVCDCNCGFPDPDCEVKYTSFICHGQEQYKELSACDNAVCIEQPWPEYMWYVIIGIPVGVLTFCVLGYGCVRYFRTRKEYSERQAEIKKRITEKEDREAIPGLPRPKKSFVDSLCACLGDDDDMDHIIPQRKPAAHKSAAAAMSAPVGQPQQLRKNLAYKHSVEV